jgi:hypothetical protein
VASRSAGCRKTLQLMGQKDRPLTILIYFRHFAAARKSVLIQFLSISAAAPTRGRKAWRPQIAVSENLTFFRSGDSYML